MGFGGVGYLIGTDEAGYGPKLGPLVVTVTVWHVPGDPCRCDLYRMLGALVTGERNHRATEQSPRLLIADSKLAYRRAAGLAGLERGVLSAVAVAHQTVRSWCELCERIAPELLCQRDGLPWLCDYDAELPADLDRRELDDLQSRFREGLEKAGVRIVGLRSHVIFPPRFNELVEQYGNKATALSEITVGLLAEAIAGLDGEPVHVVCDKHGGRNYYAALLQHHFPDVCVAVCRESRMESVYAWDDASRHVSVLFRPAGEAALQTALASMASKYLRELAMQALNRFWCQRVSGLRPTAGYAVDARRFKHEIHAVQTALGIDDALIWRSR